MVLIIYHVQRQIIEFSLIEMVSAWFVDYFTGWLYYRSRKDDVLDKVSLMVCPSMKWQATKCGDVRLTQRLSRVPHHSLKWEPIGHATSTFQIKYELASTAKWYRAGWWWWISAIVDILSIHESGAMINLPTLACSFYAWRVVFLHPTKTKLAASSPIASLWLTVTIPCFLIP